MTLFHRAGSGPVPDLGSLRTGPRLGKEVAVAEGAERSSGALLNRLTLSLCPDGPNQRSCLDASEASHSVAR